MKETAEMDLILQVPQSEVGSLMEVLKFVYTNTLSEPATEHEPSTEHLMGVLMVADKFEFTSCMRCCIDLLKEKPMSLESALLYLQLPASISSSEVVRPLLVSAKEYLTTYSDFGQSRKKMMDLPLCAIEAVLSNKGLKVHSEDSVFEFVLDWTCQHYPKLEERKEILTSLMAQCICFPCLSSSRLKQVLDSPYFGDDLIIWKRVTDALFLKADISSPTDIKCDTLGRMYKFRPVKVVQFELTQPRCVVYFNLKKEEFVNQQGTDNTFKYSDSFCVGGLLFRLCARWFTKEQKARFVVFLLRVEKASNCAVDFEFAVMSKPSKEFGSKRKGNLKNHERAGPIRDMLTIPWSDFISKDCVYFVDGIIHLRADLTINNDDAVVA